MKIHLSIACLLLTCACLSADLQVPADARIQCQTDTDCPASYRCSVTLARCIDMAMQDSVQPAFVPGTFSVTPLVANAGATIEVAFEATEPLAQLPVVELGDPGPEFTLTAGQPPEYVFSYTTTGSEVESGIAVSVYLVDLVGNEATLGGMTVTLDFTAPAIVSPAIDDNTVNVGDTVTVTFTASEELGRLPDVVWITTLPEAFSYDNTSTDYTFTLDTTGLDPGTANVRVTLTDEAGNVSEAVIDSLTVET